MNTPDPPFEIRDTLYGDMPIALWSGPSQIDPVPPWSWFLEASRHLEAGNFEETKNSLNRVLETPGIEPRHYLQAWNMLKELGVFPAENIASNVLGVVVEVALKEGLDIVAAYSDHSARYFNFSGAAVIWDHPNNALDPMIDTLLAAGDRIIQNTEPWKGPRPAAPPIGEARVSILTPGGLHFGQAPYEALASDRFGGPVLDAALQLLQALIERTTDSSS